MQTLRTFCIFAIHWWIYPLTTTYQLEGEYFAISKHGVYVTVPTEIAVKLCIESGLAICMLGQALYPAKQVTIHRR